ncbi:MAG: metallophosphoesterase [Puniceicoccaceae bacterium]
MTGRTIIIGDIHGCIREFEKLIDELSPTDGDQVVLLGDLVNRGPDSHRVVEFAQEKNFVALIGNHELRLLTFHATQDPKGLKRYDHKTLDQLTSADWTYLRQMIPFLRLADQQHLLVHGGLIPGQTPEETSTEVLCNLKRLSPEDFPADQTPPVQIATHWSKVWNGPETIVYGHTPRLAVDRQKYAIGIDTGCVYGGFLTAFVLPEAKFVRIRARKPYAK